MPPERELICFLDENSSVRHSIAELLDSDGLKARSFEDAGRMDRPSRSSQYANTNQPSARPVRAHELAGKWLLGGFDRLLGLLQARDVALPNPGTSYREVPTHFHRVSADAGGREL